MSSRTYTPSTPNGEVPVTVTERGAGTPVLLPHGGAGHDSVAGSPTCSDAAAGPGPDTGQPGVLRHAAPRGVRLRGEARRGLRLPPAYGQEYADAIPGAEFHLLPNADHLPQVETPKAVLTLFEKF